jgi:two-component system sensor histidine kinase ResE
VIHSESARLIRLVEELLDLARIDAGQIDFKRDRLDLKAIMTNVVERMGPRLAEANVEIQDEVPDFPVVIGDGDRIAQVFTNLLDNAIKHSPEGGRIRIEGEKSSSWVSISIVDQGTGIPPEELSRIFERFYQMDKARTGEGVGLGLPISHEIVRSHHGEINASSELGRGSRFTVRLPLTRPDDSTLQRRLLSNRA